MNEAYKKFISLLNQQGCYETEKPHSRKSSVVIRHIAFYFRVFSMVYCAYKRKKSNPNYTFGDLGEDAFRIVGNVESIGGKVIIEGVKNLEKISQASIFIANHMSILEIFLLPATIIPYRDVSFVVKKSLLSYPFLGEVLSTLQPIPITRTHPREDLRSIFREGKELLERNCSIIIFPQSTRTDDIEPETFNTLGIKLAKKYNVPVIPTAVKTDLWNNGKIIKDIGWIDQMKTVRIDFGKPILIRSNGGKEEHDEVVHFIRSRINTWRQKETQ